MSRELLLEIRIEAELLMRAGLSEGVAWEKAARIVAKRHEGETNA